LALLVVGSVGYDDVETPFDKIAMALGGSATFISLAAGYFTAPVNMVGVVGEDFREQDIKLLKDHNVNLDGLEIVKGGKTFRYGCKYQHDLNVRDTLFTELNVFENFDPVIPEKWRKSSYLLLGNILPSLQMKVIHQMTDLKLMVCDTMNLWINTMRDDLLKVLAKVQMLIINDSEARLLADEPHLLKAAKIIQGLGPEYLVIKKGEHGALLFGNNSIFSAPAYPVESIYDPTGAGDAFAGGFAGYLHKSRDLSFENIKKAVIYGSTMASFCVEKFSTKGLENLSDLQIQDRFRKFQELSRF
jgi:sugar/nucleoside kinase (ribokinase family)